MAVKWHLPDEDDAEASRQVLDQFENGRVNLLAPDQIRYEVVSAITVATLGRAPRLSRRAGELAIDDFLAIEIETYADGALLPAAFAAVHRHGCAFYDALYLALAQRLAVPLITADRKLYARVGYLPEVVWLGSFAAR